MEQGAPLLKGKLPYNGTIPVKRLNFSVNVTIFSSLKDGTATATGDYIHAIYCESIAAAQLKQTDYA